MKIAVIPARGGSKRIPRKNIKLFHGRPMIAYAIEAAKKSGLFEHIIVTTDDAEIAEIANSFGAEIPFMRPPELSDDFTPTVPVIAHAIKDCVELGWSVNEVCCIYPGVPLLSESEILTGYALLQQMESGYSFPVATFPSAIQRAFRRSDDGRVEPFYPAYASTRTQDLEQGFFDVGQFYWGHASAWLQGLNIHLNGRTFILPEWKVVDIDTPSDWERAELLYGAFVNTEHL